MKADIQIQNHSGAHTLKTQQFLPVTLQEAWAFFSSPEKLAEITPGKMGFRITSEVNRKTYPGQIITYKVGIFPLVKSNWITEITHVKDHHYFIDEQRFGPYAMWHHEHYFNEAEGGVLMSDIVTYKLPFGFLGRIVHALFVKRMLLQIFSFRHKTLTKLF